MVCTLPQPGQLNSVYRWSAPEQDTCIAGQTITGDHTPQSYGSEDGRAIPSKKFEIGQGSCNSKPHAPNPGVRHDTVRGLFRHSAD